VPEQLTFELAAPAPPSFANFLPGDNQELVDTLTRGALGGLAETAVVLWGGPGVGKTHLVAATLAAARAAGRPCAMLGAADDGFVDVAPDAVVGADDVARATPSRQGALFTLYNRLAAGGGLLVASAAVPPARLDVRDDLRTRLAHGLVYEVLPLRDAAKPAALARYADARGLPLPADVVAFLLARYPRDMPSLLRAVDALDRRSLAAKRAVTIAFVRDALAGRAPE
jgi:DnaA family protein